MKHVNIGDVRVSRFILGSNPFSGFSHQGIEEDSAMRHYYTAARIKETIRNAESLGIDTLIARADQHVIRVLMEYWDEGGTVQWFSQTCPELGSPESSINRAKNYGAAACYIHGGVADNLFANDKLDRIPPLIERIKEEGMLAGIAGHVPGVHEWAEEHLDVDFHMCCHYNPIPRDDIPEHVSGCKEAYLEEDRRRMTETVQRLSKPVIHYKIMAAGRNDPNEAFAYAAKAMRPNDAVCVGVYTKDNPDMLKQDVALLEKHLGA